MISVLKQIEASLSVSETWRPDRDSWRPNRNYWTMDIRNVMNISKPWRQADYSSSRAAPLRKLWRWERKWVSVVLHRCTDTHIRSLLIISVWCICVCPGVNSEGAVCHQRSRWQCVFERTGQKQQSVDHGSVWIQRYHQNLPNAT